MEASPPCRFFIGLNYVLRFGPINQLFKEILSSLVGKQDTWGAVIHYTRRTSELLRISLINFIYRLTKQGIEWSAVTCLTFNPAKIKTVTHKKLSPRIIQNPYCGHIQQIKLVLGLRQLSKVTIGLSNKFLYYFLLTAFNH